MDSAHILPSMLIFGPQTELPSRKVLADLRAELVKNPSLSSLVSAIQDLPQFWKALAKFDPALDDTQTSKPLSDLQRWILHGEELPQVSSSLPNLLTVPATVILQITQYTRYITGTGLKHPHTRVLAGLQQASARNEDGIGAIAGTILRLAVCISAYVDQDIAFGPISSPRACVAVRWKDGNLHGKEEVDAVVQQFEDVGYSIVSLLPDSKTHMSTYRHISRA
jgi:hypothetical protein